MAAASSGEQRHRSAAACDERKVSIIDEDQFEPDYDEGETAATETEHHPATSGDAKHSHHSRHKRSRHASESASKSSKKHHKKHHKKSKKHKSKSRKSDK